MMKKILFVLLIAVLATLNIKAQETPPTVDANFKQLVTSQFYIHLPDSVIWQYKGATYGWHKVGKVKDYNNFYTKIESDAKYATIASLTDYVTLTGTQTLTNKTLTAPNINTPSIVGGTYNTPTIVNGSINNATIGQSVPVQGTFTALNATVSANVPTVTPTSDSTTKAVNTAFLKQHSYSKTQENNLLATKAPITGGTGYIQNQTAIAQTADFRISGSALVGRFNIGGNTNPSVNFYNQASITGNVSSYANYSSNTIQSDVTGNSYGYRTNILTASAAFNVTNVIHFSSTFQSLGAGSSITNQTAFQAEGNIASGSTNSYGFRGLLASGANKYNLYMDGTANNYLAGNLGIGITPTSQLHILATGATPATFERSGPTNVSIEYKNSSGSWFGGKAQTTGDFTINTNASLTTSPKFTLSTGGDGTFAGNMITSGGNIQTWSGGFFKWASSSSIGSPSSGVITLNNAGSTGFTKLAFGGLTSSFPSINRNSSAFNFKLGDDSGDANITAGAGVFSGALSASNLSGTNTGDQTTVTGNAGSATVLQTARTINGVSFNGSANITVADATKEPIITAGTTSQYWRGDKSWQTLDKTAVGLANVDNTSDINKPVSTAQSTAINLMIPLTQRAANNGVATLDGSGKVPLSQLPVGGDVYKGTWNASTNTPTLADGSGTAGWYYVANVAGTQNLGSGNITYAIGDRVAYNGTIWQKVPTYQAVSSVNGQTGTVVLTTSDISEGTNKYYTEGRVSANTDVAANTAARHAAITLGTANGLSLSTQALSLGLASTSTNGALSSTDWNTFNSKQAAGTYVNSVTGTLNRITSTGGVTPVVDISSAYVGQASITTLGTIATGVWNATAIDDAYISSATNWNSAYTNRITSLTTTGSSGAATLSANVLNIPTYTLAGLGGQAQLSGTGFVKVAGTTVSYDNSTYEPAFSKNTGFNLALGTSAGTVAVGNDSRILNGQTAFGWGDHSLAGYQLAANLQTTLVASATKYPNVDAVNTGLATKQATLVSGTNIKTVGGTTILGSGDIPFPAATPSNLALGTATTTTQPITNSNGTGFTLPSATTLLAGLQSAADKTKLNGIATGATANQTDVFLLSRANHTGTQLAATISDFQASVTNNTAVLANTAKVTNATHTGEVTGATVLTIANSAVTLAKMADVATGTVFYRKTASTGAPEVQTLATLKTDLGLSGNNNGDNAVNATSNSYADAKVANDMVTSNTVAPSKAAVIAANALKQDNLVSGTNIKTVGGTSILGSGDIAFPAATPSNLALGTATATTQPITNSNGTGFVLPSSTTSIAGLLSAADKLKLDGIATNATANQTDAYLLNRTNHTGTQLAATISDFQTSVTNNTAVLANTAKVTNATHTGDVTGATALTIANSAVSFAKMQNIASGTLIGRGAIGTGVAGSVTLGTGLALSSGNVLSATNTNTGTVTSFSKTDGFGIVSSVANSTTTPNHTIAVDTSAVRTVNNSYSLSGMQTKLNNYVPTVRTLTAGYGVATIGDLSANRSVTLDSATLSTKYIRRNEISSSALLTQSNLVAKVSDVKTYVDAGLATKGAGTVTSVAAGTGMSFTTITGAGTVNADTTILATKANTKTLAQTQTALNLKANLASPNFTGTVTGITAAMVGAPSGSGTSTGTNTGDQTTITGNAGTATTLQTGRTIGIITGDATSTGSTFNGSANNTNAITVTKINGTSLAALSTGLLKNTTTTGVPSIAVAGTDYALPNSNTTGSAATLTTGRTIGITGDVTYTSPSFNGSANVTAAATVTRINGTSLAALGTGILKNTTATGVPSIAVAADFPILNQNTTGNAATVTNGVYTTRTISTGNGLTGGGDLSANRTLTADTSILATKANTNTLAQLQTRFNSKADASAIAGTSGFVPKFTFPGAIGNSSIYDTGNIIIGSTSDDGLNKLQVNSTSGGAVINTSSTTQPTLRANNTGATYSGTLLYGTTTAAGSTGFDLVGLYTNGVQRFRVDGLGNTTTNNLTAKTSQGDILITEDAGTSNIPIIYTNASGIALGLTNFTDDDAINITPGTILANTGNFTVTGNITASNLDAGTITPLITNVTNITSVGSPVIYWTRVGNIVHAQGQAFVTTTSTGTSSFKMTLPVIPATFSSQSKLTGSTNCSYLSFGSPGSVVGESGGNKAVVEYASAVAGSGMYVYFSFTYTVI